MFLSPPTLAASLKLLLDITFLKVDDPARQSAHAPTWESLYNLLVENMNHLVENQDPYIRWLPHIKIALYSFD